MPKQFKGKIELDIRDSTPDWAAFLADKAPEGAPNVLVVLYDDTGLAAWSPYGGRINMPTLDRLAANGLTYSQWHTTALCSPTRSTFLTGRNHHQNGFATISESSTGFPGYNSHIPPENAHDGERPARRRLEHVLGRQEPQRPDRRVDDGRVEEELAARPGLRPLLRLHRRRDEQVVSRPGRGQPLHRPAVPARGRLPPVEGPRRQGAAVHPRLEAVRAGQALVPVVLPRRQPRPAPRAAGVHRQVQGQVRRRLRGLPRVGAAADDRARHPARGHRADADQPDARGHVHRRPTSCGRGTRCPTTRRRLFCRMAEVYAGFSEYTDAQVGRIVDYLEESGQLDNTIIFYCADNGASGEGSPNGSVNEGKFFNGYPDDIEREPGDDRQARQPGHLQPLPDRLGGRRSRRRTGCSSATRTRAASATRWSSTGRQGIKAKGEVRHQYHHCDRHRPDDPRVLRRRDARRRTTASSRRRCRASRCATRSTPPTRRRTKETQYYEMLGTRGIWHEGWKAVDRARPDDRHRATSTRTAGSCSTPTRTAPRRTTSPTQHPEKVEELKALWFEEAKTNNVLPLNDLQIIGRRTSRRSSRWSSTSRCRRAASTPTTRARPRSRSARPPTCTACRTRCSPRSSSPPRREGVIFAHGSRFGGHALFVKDGTAHLRLQLPRHPARAAHLGAGARRSGRHIVGVEFTKERMGEHREAHRPAEAVHRRPGRRRAGDPHRARPLLALRRGPVHRLRQRRRRSARCTRRGSRSPAARSSRSSSTSPTTPTSTSSATSPRRWPATEKPAMATPAQTGMTATPTEVGRTAEGDDLDPGRRRSRWAPRTSTRRSGPSTRSRWTGSGWTSTRSRPPSSAASCARRST